MFPIYLRLLFSFIYFKVLRRSKKDVFESILKQFKNNQNPNCFAMAYSQTGNFRTRHPIFLNLVQSLSYMFLLVRRPLVFKQDDDINFTTPMLQYGKRGVLIFSISEFQKFLKSQGYYLVYVFTGTNRHLTVVNNISPDCVEYSPNKYIIGNLTPYLLGEEKYIYSMVLRDMANFYEPIKPTFFKKIESQLLKSKLDRVGEGGISYIVKTYQRKSQVNKLSDISNPNVIFGNYFGREYSFTGFNNFLASLGYSLNNDLTIAKS